MTSPPDRPPADVAAAVTDLSARGSCCEHPFGAHGPDGGCRMCAVLRTVCPGWRPLDTAATDARLSAADRIAGGMAEAIGGAMSDEQTAHRVLAALLEHRADVDVALAPGEGVTLDAALEVLRRLLMDRGQECDPWKEPCGCSTAQARRLLTTAGIQVG